MTVTKKSARKSATHRTKSAAYYSKIARLAARKAWATMRSKAYKSDTSKNHTRFFARRAA